ncbi:hypothetical protein OL233_08620 [Vagococcus sp. PNs007]|uniref:Uncharacterized protein n=1 Tax=Vagococcus proximus TaxID=2991417 RepID=A0ABT5X2X4_9ENTE|nr:hypothetical protein [Vagococcus proximus]MDF0480346.1 hypothetical protein [Vagococcus proximus]
MKLMIPVSLVVLALILLSIVTLSFKSYRDYFKKRKAKHSIVKALVLTVMEALIDFIILVF